MHHGLEEGRAERAENGEPLRWALKGLAVEGGLQPTSPHEKCPGDQQHPRADMSTGCLGHRPLLDLREDPWPGNKGCVDQSRTRTGGSWSLASLHELLSVDMEPEVAVSPFRLPSCGCSLQLALLPMRNQLPPYICSPAWPVFACHWFCQLDFMCLRVAVGHVCSCRVGSNISRLEKFWPLLIFLPPSRFSD